MAKLIAVRKWLSFNPGDMFDHPDNTARAIVALGFARFATDDDESTKPDREIGAADETEGAEAAPEPQPAPRRRGRPRKTET